MRQFRSSYQFCYKMCVFGRSGTSIKMHWCLFSAVSNCAGVQDTYIRVRWHFYKTFIGAFLSISKLQRRKTQRYIDKQTRPGRTAVMTSCWLDRVFLTKHECIDNNYSNNSRFEVGLFRKNKQGQPSRSTSLRGRSSAAIVLTLLNTCVHWE